MRKFDGASLATPVWKLLSCPIDVTYIGTAKKQDWHTVVQENVIFKLRLSDHSGCLGKVELVKSAGGFTCPKGQYLIFMVCLWGVLKHYLFASKSKVQESTKIGDK